MSSLGDLLRERREAFGSGLQEAAGWCGVSPGRLEEIETKDDLSAADFERICRGLAISPAALLSGRGNSPTRGVARFRSALDDPSILTPTDLRIIASASELGLALAELLRRPGGGASFDRYRDFRGLSAGLQPWEQGYRLGETARTLMVPLDGPILNLELTLTELGVHVARARFSTPSIEAAGVWESGAVPVILLNSSATRVEYSLSRRAILAHELCHLLHDGGEADIATRVTCAMGIGDYQEAIEQRARGFAPAFLSPTTQVHQWAATAELPENPSDLVRVLASHWGLSFEGAIWHAKNCGLIQPGIADELVATGFRVDLPADRFESRAVHPPGRGSHPELREDLTPLMDGLAAGLVFEALEDSAISLGRARELLAWR